MRRASDGSDVIEDYQMLFGPVDDWSLKHLKLSAIFDGFETSQSLPTSATLFCGDRGLERLFGKSSASDGSLDCLLRRVRDERIDLRTLT
jgi:hypothetical protein